MPGINRREFQNIPEERAISVGVFTVNDDVGARNHGRLQFN
jgi:hypothetical protein